MHGDMRLRVQTLGVEHLAHVLKHVLNIIRWKKRAGLQGDEPPPDAIQNVIRNRDSAIGAIEWSRVEKAAWDDWVQGGDVIWPGTWRGYAHPDSRFLRWPKMEFAALQEEERKLKELRAERRRQIGKIMRLEDETAAHEREKEIKALEAKVEEYRRPVDEAKIRRHALDLARPILDKREVKGCEDFAKELRRIFCSELPGQGTEAASRFMEAVMPVVTEEAMRWETIKQFVNRSARKSRDTK